MTRCVEFYERWSRDPNWCKKAAVTVREIDRYLGFIDELEGRGVDRSDGISSISADAARPIIAEKDPEIKEKAILEVGRRLRHQQHIAESERKPITEPQTRKIIQDLKHESEPEPPKEEDKEIKKIEWDNHMVETYYDLHAKVMASVRPDFIEKIEDEQKRAQCIMWIQKINDITAGVIEATRR